MGFLKRLFEPAKPRTMLDRVQESGGKIIVAGYRRIAAEHGCAPTKKTKDAKIIEIYSKVGTAFHQAGQRRGERVPALCLNTIVLKFLQVYEMLGDTGLEQHLQYEVQKYLAEGLRADYRQELQLFDIDAPDAKARAESPKNGAEQGQRTGYSQSKTIACSGCSQLLRYTPRLEPLTIRCPRCRTEMQLGIPAKPPVLATPQIPYTRIANWLTDSSATSGLCICELLFNEDILLRSKVGESFLISLCTEIATFHASYIIRLIMEKRDIEGRQNFSQIYKELNAAIGKIHTVDRISDEKEWLAGFVAGCFTNFEQRDFTFATVLSYFEGSLAEFKVAQEEIDSIYAAIHGRRDAPRNLDPFCLCVLIRAQRLIDLACLELADTISDEKHNLSIEILFECILKNDEVGFAGLSNAVINLMGSGTGDKPASELKSHKQIRADMAAFAR